MFKINAVLDNIRAYIDNGAPDMHTVGLMGNIHAGPNRSRITSTPDYSHEYYGTHVAYIETTYTYRGEAWNVAASINVAEARYNEDGPAILRAEGMTLTNIDRRATYGAYIHGAPTNAQRKAAEDALAVVLGAAIGDPVTVDKRTVLTWIENAVTRKLDYDPVTCRDADDYGRAYRDNVIYTIARVLNVYDRPNARRALGHAITDTDQNNLTNRIVLAHQRELRARARSLASI